MWMWAALLLIIVILAIVGVIYLTKRFHGFSFIIKIGKKNNTVSWLLSLLPTILIFAVFIIFSNVYAAVIVFLHLMIFWVICDFVGFVIRKCVAGSNSESKVQESDEVSEKDANDKNSSDKKSNDGKTNSKSGRKNYEGAIAIIITIIYMSIGWYNAHHVRETDYTFTTTKNLGRESLRVVEIADSHLGITLDGKKFSNEMKKIQKLNPDVVVVAGDFVDDDSYKKDMVEYCKALGELKTTYGVYFIFGNHDKGYGNYRDFTTQDLREELEKNHVVILEDESVLIDDEFYIIGRQDRTEEGRMDMVNLTKDLDTSKYMILLDHQPNDYDNEASYVDLVLSGHTHGGHIFPAGLIGLWMKANDRVYGTEVRKNTRFVVTSGISGWAIPFKTGTFSEFVVIDIKGE